MSLSRTFVASGDLYDLEEIEVEPYRSHHGKGATGDLATISDDGDLRLNFHPGQGRAWMSPKRFIFMLAGTQGG